MRNSAVEQALGRGHKLVEQLGALCREMAGGLEPSRDVEVPPVELHQIERVHPQSRE